VEVQVIHNGIDLRPLGAPPAARQEARRRLALGAEQPVIAVVGQLVDWKDKPTRSTSSRSSGTLIRTSAS
jgi:hypothetical protein